MLHNKMENMEQKESVFQLQQVEQALQIYNKLILKEGSCKIELDLPEGQEVFRQYVQQIQSLIKNLHAQTGPRDFRNTYTNAYRVLYQDGSLGYIPEIYDSAQEGFPFIYVNSERYDFSPEVIILGEKLVENYYKLVHELRIASLRGEEWKNTVRAALQQFDQAWINYEQKYIQELIRIQKHSKIVIKDIIHAQEQLLNFQNQQKMKGRIFLSGPQYDLLRNQLCQKISKLNSIANVDGKGRDDLTFEVLIAAENVLATVTQFQAKSVRVLAQKIRQSFQNVRQVLRFFGQNIDMVDPQLRNNPELVLALQQYECYWQKGKRYFMQPKKQSQMVAFSTIVEAAKEKYHHFRQLLQYSDPSIFWIIPSLIVLRSLQEEDEGLAESFLQSWSNNEKQKEHDQLKKIYLEAKGYSTGCFSLYNRLEGMMINPEEQCGQTTAETKGLLLKIKEMAVSLERISPMDWNDMLGVLLVDSPQ